MVRRKPKITWRNTAKTGRNNCMGGGELECSQGGSTKQCCIESARALCAYLMMMMMMTGNCMTNRTVSINVHNKRPLTHCQLSHRQQPHDKSMGITPIISYKLSIQHAGDCWA